MTKRRREGSLDGLSKQVRDLIAAYKSQKHATQKQKAMLAKRIWEAIGPNERREWERDYFLRAALGESTSSHKLRMTLAYFGTETDVLWHRIDSQKMPLRTAVEMLVKAKKLRSSERITIDAALKRVLSDYDKLPLVFVLSDGSIIRKKHSQGTPRRSEAKARAKRSSNGQLPQTPKELYVAIRNLVAGYVASQLDDLDEESAEAMYGDFEIDLKLTIDSLREKISTHRRVSKEQTSLNERSMKRRLRESFDELAMKRPQRGSGTLPELSVVKRQYRRLASLYHPDKTPGIDLSAKFQAVTEAYHFICAYYAKKEQQEASAENGTT